MYLKIGFWCRIIYILLPKDVRVRSSAQSTFWVEQFKLLMEKKMTKVTHEWLWSKVPRIFHLRRKNVIQTNLWIGQSLLKRILKWLKKLDFQFELLISFCSLLKAIRKKIFSFFTFSFFCFFLSLLLFLCFFSFFTLNYSSLRCLELDCHFEIIWKRIKNGKRKWFVHS